MRENGEILLVIQCFTRGIRKYIGSMKKVVLGEAKPHPIQPFFMDPIYFRIPPVKHCVTNLSHRRPFLKYNLSPHTTYQKSVYICHGPF